MTETETEIAMETKVKSTIKLERKLTNQSQNIIVDSICFIL